MFDIYTLFKQNHPEFVKKHPKLTCLITKIAGVIWMEKTFQDFTESNSDKRGAELLTACLEHINFKTVTPQDELDNIPRTGRLIIVANHPMGNLDGIALLVMIAKVRPDVKLLVSGTLHTMLGMPDLTIPVNNFSQTMSKDSYKGIRAQLENDGAVVLFPTRRYSDLVNGETTDHPWKGSFLRFARDTGSAVLPIYIDAKNSDFYYSLIKFCMKIIDKQLWTRELIQMRMMREIFSTHRDSSSAVRIGKPLSIEQIDKEFETSHDKINFVREKVYALKKLI